MSYLVNVSALQILTFGQLMNTKHNNSEKLKFDQEHIWHPYTSLTKPQPCIEIISASACKLKMANGKELIDGMSSWWSAIHGYNVPELNQAATQQLEKMSHVMFGGITHDSAITLCQTLVDITPQKLDRVFLADSGSVAVEVAMKMALQYCHAKAESNNTPAKSKFLSLSKGYHGDTFGAMSVCDPNGGMHSLYKGFVPEHYFAPAPSPAFGETATEQDLAPIKDIIEQHHSELAAVIVEPIVQGAGGMRFYSSDTLKGIRELCDQYELLLICDEIATGFGRTGKLFACEHANIQADILCLGKAITGGYMTLAATLTTKEVANTICNGQAGVFMHGPTFMGNALACSVANASLKLLLESPWQQRVAAIERQLENELGKCRILESVSEVRVLGAIGVVELKQAVDSVKIQEEFIKRGVWIRPFGKLVYLMPPYIITPEELTQLTRSIYEVLNIQN